MKALRLRFRDVAFKFRMGSGFPGDVLSAHPFSVIPRKINTTLYPTAYGQAVLVNSAKDGVRRFDTDDTAVTKLAGVTVRPVPIQQAQTNVNYGAVDFGSATPPVSGVIDVLDSGFIIVKVNGTPGLGDPVYVWCAADSGAHKQGYFEASSTGGSTAAIANAVFAGTPDADGYVPIRVTA